MTKEFLLRLQEACRRAEALCGPRSGDALNARPAPDAWSVAQLLDHAARTAAGIASECESALDARGGQTGEAPAWTPSFLEKQFLKAVGPDARGRTPVPPKFAPASEPLNAEELLSCFLDAHRRLIALAERATPADLVRVRARSSAMPLLTMRLAAWLQAAAIHADYHLGQAEALAAGR